MLYVYENTGDFTPESRKKRFIRDSLTGAKTASMQVDNYLFVSFERIKAGVIGGPIVLELGLTVRYSGDGVGVNSASRHGWHVCQVTLSSPTPCVPAPPTVHGEKLMKRTAARLARAEQIAMVRDWHLNWKVPFQPF